MHTRTHTYTHDSPRTLSQAHHTTFIVWHYRKEISNIICKIKGFFYIVRPGVQSYTWECHGSLDLSSILIKTGLNHDMKPLSLPNNSFTHLYAELHAEQFMFKKVYTPLRSEMKWVVRTYVSDQSLKELPGQCPNSQQRTGAPTWSVPALLHSWWCLKKNPAV